MIPPITNETLQNFLIRARAATYVGGGEAEKEPERVGFLELVYTEGDLDYRDSYTGFFRSSGMELIRYKGKPLWACTYGGGMIKGKESLAKDTFHFLKKALSSSEEGFASFRGPHEFLDNEWDYSYQQVGDIEEFNGEEEIQYLGEKVFFHKIIGGVIKDKDSGMERKI